MDTNDQVKMLQKHMGGFVQMLKDLQARVKELEEKKLKTKDDALEEKQEFENTIAVNSDTVKKLDKEIKNLLKDKNKKDNSKKEVDEALKRLDKEILQIKENNKVRKAVDDIGSVDKDKKKEKKCRYFNYGHCKYKQKCRFLHPKDVCKGYLEGNCEGSSCPNRHPKPCKWFGGEMGCTRKEECDFSHETLAFKDQQSNAHKSKSETLKCVSCKSEWKESNCVVEHKIEDKEVYFCLNCEDWVQHKNRVLDQGWSLFDQDGNLNNCV